MMHLAHNSNWFHIQMLHDDIYLIEEKDHVASYLIKGKNLSALIDTGMGFCDLNSVIKKMIKTPVIVFNTHWHFDHIGGNAFFEKVGISPIEKSLALKPIPPRVLTLYIKECLRTGIRLPAHLSAGSYTIAPTPSFFDLKENTSFDLGGRTIQVIATPGHTKGSLSFFDTLSGALFCGDLIYRGTLYAHLSDSDLNAYIHSIENILLKKGDIQYLHPSHNDHTLSRTYAKKVLAALQLISSSPDKGTPMHWMGEEVLIHQYHEITVLTPNSEQGGVDLFNTKAL